MIKICLVQKELKDKNFLNDSEKINFMILKALSDSPFIIDIFCANNNLSKKYAIEHINVLGDDDFFEKAFQIVNQMNYNLTFSTEYSPADIVYLSAHTTEYTEHIVKSKFEALYNVIFHPQKYKNIIRKSDNEKKYTQKNKVIITPSIILKNDIINTLHADGQNVYILPPSVVVPKNVKVKPNDIFTFGFIGNDFTGNGGYILLKSLLKIKDFQFKLKIIYPNKSVPKYTKMYLKHFKLDDKVEFIELQSDMNSFYKNIDCLLVPAKKDGLGLSVLEAMSRGKIVVVSSRCGAKDIIEHDNNGMIFDVTTNPVVNLARLLKYILINKDDFESMRQKAVYTASVYNQERFNDELYRLINKCVKNKSEEV